MKCLERNKIHIYYAPLTGTAESTDGGLRTGTVYPQYGNVQMLKASVSPARGSANFDLFGLSTDYTHTVIVDDANCGIDENSALWLFLGKMDEFSASASYYVGAYAIHGGKIYKAVAAVSHSAWRDADWTEVPSNYRVVGVARSFTNSAYAVRELL